MRFEPIFVGGNVIRFPVELRGEAVDRIAARSGAGPHGSDADRRSVRTRASRSLPRDHSDRAMAERIALTIFPVNAAERRSALSAMV